MPKFDGSGPRGQGSMTGRKMGKCQGASPQNFKENSGTPRRGRGGFFSKSRTEEEK